ncbi:MAG: sigma-70 family RNA polymerase sigma factor [Saprospiraceae bacterium]|jgi:RNA polymerase sigma-70 factor (ECF subfamily)
MATTTKLAQDSVERTTRTVFEVELLPLMDAVFNFAVRLTSDTNRAEDLVQETFMKAWRAVSSYQPGTNAKAWLFRICQNAFINDYRSRSRGGKIVDYEELVAFHNDDEPSTNRYLDMNVEFGDQGMGDEIMTALNNMKPEFRVIVLLDLEEFTYKEIAAILDIPLNTVRTRLHRGRAQLRKNLEDYAKSQGYNVSDTNQDNDQVRQQDQSATDTDATVDATKE